MRRNLSSDVNTKTQGSQFAHRFAEACGSSEPARVQRLLKISYQAAKNYLGGRLPNSKVLLLIAERTPYSIHWLLTGEGEKLASGPAAADTPPPARQIKAMIRQECVEVVNELLARRGETRVVILDPDKIRSEKMDERDMAPNAPDWNLRS